MSPSPFPPLLIPDARCLSLRSKSGRTSHFGLQYGQLAFFFLLFALVNDWTIAFSNHPVAVSLGLIPLAGGSPALGAAQADVSTHGREPVVTTGGAEQGIFLLAPRGQAKKTENENEPGLRIHLQRNRRTHSCKRHERIANGENVGGNILVRSRTDCTRGCTREGIPFDPLRRE